MTLPLRRLGRSPPTPPPAPAPEYYRGLRIGLLISVFVLWPAIVYAIWILI